MLQRALDLIYRPVCPACDAVIDAGDGLCRACADSLYPIDAACPGCAEPVEGPRDLRCARCTRKPLPLDGIRSPYRFGGQLAVALRRLKFRGRRDVARQLAPLVAPALAGVVADIGAELVVPVPLHWRRACARGFNQTQLLLAFAGPPDTDRRADLLRRPRATRPQPGLSRPARAANLAGAFVVPSSLTPAVTGRRVLVFDDVVTTGATMAACARALREAGADAVYGFSVARAESP